MRWAIAGRNKGALQMVLNEHVRPILEQRKDSMEPPEILTAILEDITSLDKLVTQAKVLLTTTGPFVKLGLPIAEACVRNGTDYIDSTGEPQYVRKLIDNLNERARDSKVVLVPCCAFDSLPSDICTFIASEEMKTKYNMGLSDAKFYIRMRATVSRGTIASAIEVMYDKDSQQFARDRFYLAPDLRLPNPLPPKPKRTLVTAPKEYKHLTATPWLMEVINSKIVYRTYSLRDFAYGPKFSYSEFFLQKSRLFSYIWMFVMALFFFLVNYMPGFHWILRQILPYIPEEASKERLAKSHYTLTLIAYSDDDSRSKRVDVEFSNNADIGYSDSAVMVL